MLKKLKKDEPIVEFIVGVDFDILKF